MDNSVRIGSPPASSSAMSPAASTVIARNLLRLWPLMVAGLVMAGLLFTLATVVRQAVQQAQARHAGTAARADANFRCNTMAGEAQRNDCRARAAGLLVDTASSRP